MDIKKYLKYVIIEQNLNNNQFNNQQYKWLT